MHPKSSKKAHIRRVGDPKIPAFPLQRRRPRHTPGTWFLLLLSVTLIAAGVLARFGEGFDPQLLVVSESINAWGLDAGTLFVGGLVLFGVTVTSRQQRVHAATILAPSSVDEAVTELGADLAEFRNKLYDLSNDQVEMHSVVQSMRQEAELHYHADRTDEVVQAIFRVAGSLDTLHAKLDQRMGTAQDSIVHALGDVSHLVEASRDFLQESMEDAQQSQVALGEEVRRQLDEVTRTVAMKSPPQIVLQHPGGALVPTVVQTDAEEESPDEAVDEVDSENTDEPTGESRLGAHHDANAWFQSDEDTEENEVAEVTEALEALEALGVLDDDADAETDESSGDLQIAMPGAPLPAASSAQETRLGLLDRFDENEVDSEPEEPAEEESPMSVLDGMQRAMEEEQGVEAESEPLEVRFDEPPQPPQGTGHVSPPQPDGTTIVQLDEPGPALPAEPPPFPALDPLPQPLPPESQQG